MLLGPLRPIKQFYRGSIAQDVNRVSLYFLYGMFYITCHF
jgi:hypothetical protein